MSRFNFYIDEAGDEGIDTGGTQWFLIGGILVAEQDDLAVSRAVDRVKAAIGQREPRRPLHWADIKRSHQKRLFAIQEFGQLPVSFILCAMHKPSLEEKAVFKRKQQLYNYVTRHVIERVSWLVRDVTSGQGFVSLIFEKRTNMSYEVLNDYLDRLKAQPASQLVGQVVGQAVPRAKDQCKNLQIADAYAGACFAAFEANALGMCDGSYIGFVRERFYRRNGNLFSYGLKILPHDCADRLREGMDWTNGF